MGRGAEIVFATERYGYLADRLAAHPGFARGEVEHRRFPDGEHYRRIRTDVLERNVTVVGGTIDEVETLALYDLASGLVAGGAHILTMVIPYFGYSTMERAARDGEVVVAKTRAKLLSSVPEAGSGNRAVLVDLHVEAVMHYFESGLRPIHLPARPLIGSIIRRLGGAKGFVLGATDAGRAKWVEHLANQLGVGAAIVLKRRLTGEEVELIAVAADVAGQRVVVYDDMIRTGGSLLQAARAYRDAGAASVAAVATHGVFPDGAVERLRQSGLLEGIVVTDTHPRALAVAQAHPDFVEVASIGDLLVSRLSAAPTDDLPEER
jgi:ribose-phosphate pyrophosphokinase